MTPIISEIKRKTENMVCIEHHQTPEVIAYGEKIEFKCCCEPFKSKLYLIAKKNFEEYASKALKESFQKAFKGSKYIKFK